MQKTSKGNILIGVCGGIASYKVCSLVRTLIKREFSVKVMMTPAACEFVRPLTFQTLSQNVVYLDMFSLKSQESIEHISLAEWADMCVIAPLSANTLSKIAQGICDNLLTTVVCALPKGTKVLLAPAMNEHMWKNEIIKENTRRLKRIKKYIFIPPAKGELACGVYGEGRMAEAGDIYKKIKEALR